MTGPTAVDAITYQSTESRSERGRRTCGGGETSRGDERRARTGRAGVSVGVFYRVWCMQ